MLWMHHKKQKAETQVNEYIPILWLGKYEQTTILPNFYSPKTY